MPEFLLRIGNPGKADYWDEYKATEDELAYWLSGDRAHWITRADNPTTGNPIVDRRKALATDEAGRTAAIDPDNANGFMQIRDVKRLLALLEGRRHMLLMSVRDAGLGTLRQLAAGRACKPHSIGDKSLKPKAFANQEDDQKRAVRKIGTPIRLIYTANGSCEQETAESDPAGHRNTLPPTADFVLPAPGREETVAQYLDTLTTQAAEAKLISDAHCTGLVGWWATVRLENADGDYRQFKVPIGIRYVGEAPPTISPPPTGLDDDHFAGRQMSFARIANNPASIPADAFTGDYDLHDLLNDDPVMSVQWALLQELNKAVGRHFERPKGNPFNILYDLFQHGPQARYKDFYKKIVDLANFRFDPRRNLQVKSLPERRRHAATLASHLHKLDEIEDLVPSLIEFETSGVAAFINSRNAGKTVVYVLFTRKDFSQMYAKEGQTMRAGPWAMGRGLDEFVLEWLPVSLKEELRDFLGAARTDLIKRDFYRPLAIAGAPDVPARYIRACGAVLRDKFDELPVELQTLSTNLRATSVEKCFFVYLNQAPAVQTLHTRTVDSTDLEYHKWRDTAYYFCTMPAVVEIRLAS